MYIFEIHWGVCVFATMVDNIFISRMYYVVIFYYNDVSLCPVTVCVIDIFDV